MPVTEYKKHESRKILSRLTLVYDEYTREPSLLLRGSHVKRNKLKINTQAVPAAKYKKTCSRFMTYPAEGLPCTVWHIFCILFVSESEQWYLPSTAGVVYIYEKFDLYHCHHPVDSLGNWGFHLYHWKNRAHAACAGAHPPAYKGGQGFPPELNHSVLALEEAIFLRIAARKRLNRQKATKMMNPVCKLVLLVVTTLIVSECTVMPSS
jgi:hypothetical protein